MAKARQNTVDFNSVLMGLNLIVACLVASAYSLAEGHEFMNQNTILLGLVLSLQTHVALQIERARRDPFVIMLAFITIVYYSFRLYTLALFSFSNVFLRYAYLPSDSNFALVFILIANLFLYGGFFCVRFPRNPAIDLREWRPAAPSRVVALMLVSLIYFYFSAIYWAAEDEPRILVLTGSFISPPVIFLMALSYFLLFRKTLSNKAAIAIGSLIVLEIVVHTLAGSRSGVTTLIENVMLTLLAISGSIKFKRGYFILGCVLAPFVLALLVGTFTISTFNRMHKEGTSLNLVDSVEMAGVASQELGADAEWEIVLRQVFDRAAFFDFSAEIIAHADIYKSVFNVTTYAESIVDNLLTPGFDVFDQPKISSTLIFLYADLGVPSKQIVETGEEDYHSDQFGLYGELYALMGYTSLPLFFLIAFGLKRLYVGLRSQNPFALAMKRLILLVVFVKMVNSYGMDWTIMEILPFMVAIYLYKFFFLARRSAPARSLQASSGLDLASGARDALA